MNSYAKLIETHIISFKEVLVLNYKRIELNEQEAMIIILLYEQKKHSNNALSVSSIEKYVTIPHNELSQMIVSLVERGYIELQMNGNQECFSLLPTINRLGAALGQNDDLDYKGEIKLIVSDLEKTYARPLTASELLIVQRWITEEYSIDLIKNAVQESLKLNRYNVRYIDSILVNKIQRNADVEVDPNIEEVLKQIHVTKR